MLNRKKHTAFKKDLELKKHVATIHSTNRLTLLQRKISNALLFNAYDDLLDKDEHEIHIGTLCRLIGYNSNDHKMIKRALVELLSTVLEWNLVDGKKLDSNEVGIWNASSIIADASIDGSICTYSYSNKMKKLLYRPELYGRLNMAVQAQFQSSYGLALYENCIRYQDIGKTPWFELIQFRKLMGVEDNKYKVFRDFKSRVLEKATEEINKYSSIEIDTQLRKQGRQVVAIQFLIKQNKVLINAPAVQEYNLPQILKEKFGFSKKQIAETLSSYDGNYIREKITLTECSPSFKIGKIKNLARFLQCALKEDYQNTKSSMVAKHDNREKIKSDMEINKQKQLLEKHKEAYKKYCNAFIDNVVEKLEERTKSYFIKEFTLYAAESIQTVLKLQYRKYNKETVLQSPQIKALLRQFAKEKFPKEIESMVNFEDFNSSGE